MEHLYDYDGCAQYLGISVSSVRKMVREGKLPVLRLHRRHVRILESSLEKLVREAEQKAGGHDGELRG